MRQRPWHASYGNTPIEIDADAYPSVVAMMEAAMVEFADRPAFKCFGQTLSYADVDRLSRDFAAYLQSRLGVRKGDRIALMTPNFMAFPIAFLGIARAGAVQVNVNPLYTPRELEHQLRDADARILVGFSGASATVAEVLSRPDAQSLLQTVIMIGPGDGTAAALPSPPVDARLQGTIALAQALMDGESLPFAPVALGGEDLLFLQYTGGTTGLSKGAALTHRNLVANVQQFKSIVADNLRPGEEVIVTAIPLYHIFALMVNFVTYFSVGAENWLVPNPRDMDSLIDVLKASRCTVFTGVNMLFAGVATHPRAKEVNFSRLRMAAGGGSAILEPTSAKWEALTGCPVREGYGMSETSPVISFNLASAGGYNGTTGVPLPSTDVMLLKEDGTEAAQGEAGEVCVKGPQVMRGYWQQPQANAEAFTSDGYFRTGDVGLFTPDGLLKLVDRKKDMIIVSGFNVFPNEIEGVATACPGVLECACVGVPDERTGEAAKLYVVRAPGADVGAEQIVAHCRSQLTAYKVPKQVAFVDALPKSTVGKILRRELRQIA
ncbi:AMP-dependent synthetase and ligase [Sphingomonas sp. SKA58]|uniref:AMP-binding protein n=1 Tax=Sphingomonas sp. (strain SKA58) TaxID=314266 RepID=UPI0000D7BC8D|nr:AMP-binding protein [Sphingomonas sp. SKA58]EAT07126.1 AMP-dependent synthetase and ligase [Sphingomonas sp. SKA58]